jgi:hypothetical protein
MQLGVAGQSLSDSPLIPSFGGVTEQPTSAKEQSNKYSFFIISLLV